MDLEGLRDAVYVCIYGYVWMIRRYRRRSNGGSRRGRKWKEMRKVVREGECITVAAILGFG